nr:MAG TPA: hypothetical protein [Caudoviricetes sp.]
MGKRAPASAGTETSASPIRHPYYSGEERKRQ